MGDSLFDQILARGKTFLTEVSNNLMANPAFLEVLKKGVAAKEEVDKRVAEGLRAMNVVTRKDLHGSRRASPSSRRISRPSGRGRRRRPPGRSRRDGRVDSASVRRALEGAGAVASSPSRKGRSGGAAGEGRRDGRRRVLRGPAGGAPLRGEHDSSCSTSSRPPMPGEVRHRFLDLNLPFADGTLYKLLLEEKPDVIVHLAQLRSPSHQTTYAHELNSIGALHVFAADREAKVPRVILGSTSLVYGARATTRLPDQDRPLRPAPRTGS